MMLHLLIVPSWVVNWLNSEVNPSLCLSLVSRRVAPLPSAVFRHSSLSCCSSARFTRPFTKKSRWRVLPTASQCEGLLMTALGDSDAWKASSEAVLTLDAAIEFFRLDASGWY